MNGFIVIICCIYRLNTLEKNVIELKVLISILKIKGNLNNRIVDSKTH